MALNRLDDSYRQMMDESDRALSFMHDQKPYELQRFIDVYIAKQRELGSLGSYASATLALQNWRARGYSYEAAIRRVEARSSLNTLQEQQVGLANEEWRIIVACILLNQTHGRQVRPMISQLLARAPGPREFCRWMQQIDGPKELQTLLKPLGFNQRRQRTLTAMSDSFLMLNCPPAEATNAQWAESLPGVGPYARDSLDIFRYGHLRTTCTDTWLNDYVKWRIEHGRT